MNKHKKLILSILGLAAIIIPAVLLFYISGSTGQLPQPASGSRQVDTKVVEEAIKRVRPSPTIEFFLPTPSPATSSASPTPDTLPNQSEVSATSGQ